MVRDGGNWPVGPRTAVSILALGTALVLAAPAWSQTLFTNPGFETGDGTGWTFSGGYWHSTNSDGTPTWPPPVTDYSGPATQASIQTAGNFDAFTGAPVVFGGQYSMRLNDTINDYSITAMSQSVTNYAGSKLYYAWNAVLEPSHGATDSPSFIIKVTDNTTNKVINNISYSAFTAQNTTVFRTVGSYVTSDWKVEEIDMISGHDYEMLFIALDCPYGGHRGYVYVDGFGNAIPVPNADVDFDPTTDITRGSDILIPIGGKPDIDTAKPFYTTTELANDEVNPKFVGGTLQSDTADEVSSTFTVDTAGGTIDTNSFDVTYSGGFGGVGSMIKTGLGTATLTSFASAINGSFTVNQGTLAVNDVLSAQSVDVNSGGTLAGGGGVAADINVNEGGTLAPGALVTAPAEEEGGSQSAAALAAVTPTSAVGTLSVIAGDVLLADGSTFAVDIDGRAYAPEGGPGTYDRLNLMTGSTFDPNGTIAPKLRGITGANNTFTPTVGDAFVVVAGGDVGSGEFDAVAQPAEGLAPNTRFDVIYRPTSVIVVATPGSLGTWGQANGWKVNAISAATALDPLRPRAGARSGAFYNLFDGIYGQTSAQMGYTFSQISGEVHADTMQLAQGAAREVGQIAMGAAMEPWGCSPPPQTPGNFQEPPPAGADDGCGVLSTSKGATVWGQYLGQKSDVDEDNIAYGFEQQTDGLIAGINVLNRDGMRLGAGASYSDGDLSSGTLATAGVKTVSGFLYGALRFGGFSVGAVAEYSSTDVDTQRRVGLTTGVASAADSYKIQTLSGAIEARYDLLLGARTVLRPVVGIEYAHTTAKSVTETGSATVALVLPEEKWNSARTKLGAELAVGVGNPVEAGVYGNWRHELNDATATRVAKLGAASWIVSSVAAKDDTFEAGARLAIKVSNNIKFRFDYGIVRGGAYDYDRGMAGVAISF